MKRKTLANHHVAIVWIAALLPLAVVSIGFAGPAPASQSFATELDAVVAATGHYNPLSINQDREFMGAVLREGSRYSFTVGAGKPGRDQITVRVTVPVGAVVVAFWHTHGAQRRGNQYFSNVDTALVEAWQKPLYLADHTGVLKVMSPGGRTISRLRARRLGLPARAGFARGKIVSDTSGAAVRIATREQADSPTELR